MTDDEVDALLHPPRQWPPLSAAAAAGLLLMPPLVTVVLVFSGGRPVADLLIPLVGLLIVVRPVSNLLRGRTAGVGGGLGVLALVALVCGLPAAFALLNGAGLELALAAVPVVSWLGLTGFLLWWPETRRWCGLLPPHTDEDADP